MKKLNLLSFLLIPLLSIGQWIQIGSDIDGEINNGNFGRATCLSSDGNILAIGAYIYDPLGMNNGYVRIYQNNGGVWLQIGNDIEGEIGNNNFGFSLSLSSNGNMIAISDVDNGDNGYSSGQVRVYQNNGGIWQQVGNEINGEASEDESGYSVSLSSNGNIVAIGAVRNSDNGNHSGHARVFQINGGIWEQIGVNIVGEAIEDNFGFSVSLSSNGNIVAIGAPFNDGNGNISGHVRIYQNIGGSWQQIGNDIDGEEYGQESGRSISLSSDGNILAIGARMNDGGGIYSGHVRVYENIGGTWEQIGSDIDGEAAYDQSGWSVSLSADGNTVAIGAIGNNDNGSISGHVRMYSNHNGIWQQIGSDINGEAASDQSGWAVSLSSDGNTVAIGAIGNSADGANRGHVRVFSYSKLSIQKNTFGSNLKVYPNPSFGISKIHLGNNYNEVTVQVYTILGKLLSTQKHSNSNEIVLDTQKITTGIYLVKVQSGVKQASLKLVVK